MSMSVHETNNIRPIKTHVNAKPGSKADIE